jgi:sortase (surface protein transpeptidase)
VGWSGWRRSRLLRAGFAVGLAVVGAVLMVVALVRPSVPGSAVVGGPDGDSVPSLSAAGPKPTSERSATRAGQDDVRDKISGLVLPESDPVAVSIPGIGVHSRLVKLGRDPKNGEMETPRPAVAGWYTGGAAPGALGPAVIAGHVTWDRAPAIFYRLGSVRKGDQVSVTREDGKTALFTVTRVDQFSKSRFPRKAVYGQIDHAGLRLITCGGSYDADNNSYRDNIIVFARLQAVHGPGR